MIRRVALVVAWVVLAGSMSALAWWGLTCGLVAVWWLRRTRGLGGG